MVHQARSPMGSICAALLPGIRWMVRSIKYFITNILYWLGQVELCIAEGAAEPTSFRL